MSGGGIEERSAGNFIARTHIERAALTRVADTRYHWNKAGTNGRPNAEEH
jgi:hypothetical protein